MAVGDDEAKVRAERARAIGLFRYQLIREAADAALSTKERGKMVRELASREHLDPFGRRVRISRQTIDRWIRDWRAGGFDALVPNPRQCTPRTPAEVLELAVALRRENPQRTAAAIQRILRTQLGWAPDERTLQRNFHRLGLTGATAGSAPAVFGRFEAEHPNDLWIGDVLHGLRISVRKTYLFAFLDDHSRLVPGYRWGHAEDTVRLAAALRPALASRGVPNGVYVDNGSPYVDAWLLRACAKLGVRLVHSTPGRPEGRGKIERFFRTVREQFLVEITGEPDVVGRHYAADLAELNRLFTAWVETVYHRTVHSETGQTPLQRWSAGGPIPLPAPETLTEAFLWEGTPPRDQDRHRLAAWQPLRDRPGAGRAESGVGVRPVRFDPHRGAAGRCADGAGHSASHRAPFTPESQTRNPHGATETVRHRLRAVNRDRARSRTRPRRQLRRPHRGCRSDPRPARPLTGQEAQPR